MNQFFYLSVENSIFYICHGLLIAVFMLSRFLSRESYKDLGDVMNQYFYAIKAFLQPSVSPLVQSRSEIFGRSYYTVGFYWFCGFLGSLTFSKKIFGSFIKKDNILFTNVAPELADSLKSGLLWLKILSNIGFPLVTLILFSYLSINTFPSSCIGLILSMLSLILVNSHRSFQYFAILFPYQSE